MIGEMGDLAAERARLAVLRSGLGAQLSTYRTAAGISQPQLGHALGRTRSLISKVEHGVRRLPEQLWTIADELCDAQGALITAHTELMQAEADYQDRRRTTRRPLPPTPAQLDTRHRVWSAPAEWVPAGHQPDQDVTWSQTTLVTGELAEELLDVVTRLVRSLGRREAIGLAGSILAAVGLSGLDADEYARVAHAVAFPSRIDAQVINNLAVTLTVCKRQEDRLGPCQVLDTVVAQHGLVRRLLAGDCAENLRKALSLVDSNVACTIGSYLIDMGQPEAAGRYLHRARRAAHNAGNPTYAAYATIDTSFVAFQRGDTPTALDTAAAARSLAARTDDAQLKAWAEQAAAGAYALDGQYGPCMSASARAHDLLTTTNGNNPDSPAYWVHHGTIGGRRSTFLTLLGKSQQAVEAANVALAHYDTTEVARYAHCQVRLGHALVLSKDITHAARVLGDAAGQAHLYPRLTTDLHTARALMQPWNHTHAVKALDDQLTACGLTPTTRTTPHPVTSGDQQV
ncbi:MAG: helix-turn-helix domain-containing protein [Pseudonocardiaceae bacterium]